MKLAYAGVAVCALAISGCAFVTERTGLTNDQQICIATSAAAVIQEPATRELPMLEKIGAVAAACGIKLSGPVNDVIETSILAADAPRD